ncbi:MAG: response regulator [Gemmatimonadaceae bacterium]|nr:response regulator [Chitinophagaceae bacterium]
MQVRQAKIFVVEDNPVFQTLVHRQLETISQDVRIFSKGEQFLAELNDEVDIIVLDYHLEGTMTGYDVLKALKGMENSPPVIFFSANLELTITSSILKLGVAEYIEKSIFTLARLKDCVTKVLKSSMGASLVL